MSRSEKKKIIDERKTKAGYTKDPEMCRNCKHYEAALKGVSSGTNTPFCLHPDNLFKVEPQAICDFYRDKDNVSPTGT